MASGAATDKSFLDEIVDEIIRRDAFCRFGHPLCRIIKEVRSVVSCILQTQKETTRCSNVYAVKNNFLAKRFFIQSFQTIFAPCEANEMDSNARSFPKLVLSIFGEVWTFGCSMKDNDLRCLGTSSDASNSMSSPTYCSRHSRPLFKTALRQNCAHPVPIQKPFPELPPSKMSSIRLDSSNSTETAPPKHFSTHHATIFFNRGAPRVSLEKNQKSRSRIRAGV